MTADLPRGSAPSGEAASGGASDLRGPVALPGTAVVVLVSAAWAGPSRPAPTVLRELARRWGGQVHALLVEDPTDELLDLLQVEALPTWMRFLPAELHAPGPTEDRLTLEELSGITPSGGQVSLPGPWVLVHRRTGALPKHVVDAEFGPDA